MFLAPSSSGASESLSTILLLRVSLIRLGGKHQHSVYGKTFDHCLENLDKVLQSCAEKDLVLNWEKCHFMVCEGIVLGHLVSERGIGVDRAKIEV